MRVIRPIAWLLSGLFVIGCQADAVPLDDTDASVSIDRIEMHDNSFDPQVVEVPVGTTVTWEFTDGGRAHNVVADDFASDMQTDGTFVHTFDQPGTYDYECTLHRGMTGRVVVTDS